MLLFAGRYLSSGSQQLIYMFGDYVGEYELGSYVNYPCISISPVNRFKYEISVSSWVERFSNL